MSDAAMAPVWKRILKWTAWSFGGALALVVVAYLTLLAINWRDRPPSAAAERLAAAYRDRPPIADSDNAYVYAMGLDVAPDGDPRAAGIRRIEWLQSFPGDLDVTPSPAPVPAYDSYKSARSPEVRQISESCWRLTPNCASALEGGEDAMRAWVAWEQWLLDRYLILLGHAGWQEAVASDVRAPWPSYSPLFEGQKLLLARAYLLASENKVAEVRELLGTDARFWRRVLVSSDLLITKMIATAALTRTFQTGNLILRRLPPQSQLAAMPPQWTEPLSIAERSLFRCLTGEWILSNRIMQQSMDAQTPLSDFVWEVEDSYSLLARATDPLMQLQDFSNRQADVFIRATEALDVPVEQLSAGIDNARRIFTNPEADRSALAMLYNPIGTLLFRMSVFNYDRYPGRIADLEGARRAAVLTTQLRARNIDEHGVAAALGESDIRNPYNGEPFMWDVEEQAISFIGLEPGERGRFPFKY